MRDIGASLLRAQRARSILGKNLLIRCVLTYGSTTHTYTTTRIKELTDTERFFSHKASTLLEDNDKVVHGLDLQGYKAVLSAGLITKAGEEWIAMPPLWVTGQQKDSYRDRLECSLSLEGTFDRMAKHKAESTYTQESTDTNTVKDLLTETAEATLAPYTNYPAYTITFDSEDDLIDSFRPKDGFRINLNETRGAKFFELLRYTDCVARVENDEAIHIFVPTKTGTTYDNEYSLVEGRDYHNFFSKRLRNRIVSPNKVVFKSHPSYGDGYNGDASDASASLTDMLEAETHYVRATSDSQCTNLAYALLSKYQMEDEKGSGVLPFVHFGQEIYDYVKFTDARAGDSAIGNIGFVQKYYKPGQFNMALGFGKVPLGVAMLQGLASETGISAQSLMPYIRDAFGYIDQILDELRYTPTYTDVSNAFEEFRADAYLTKLTVTERFRGPYGADKYG